MVDREYSYDECGYLTERVTHSGTTTTDEFEHDAFGNLRVATMDAGGLAERTIEYLVDGLGRRIGRRVDGEFAQGFLYMDAIRPVAELDHEGVVVSAFVYGSKPHVPDYMVSRKEGDWKLYRIVSDALGSVRLVVRVADGLVVQRSDWSAYGIELARDEETGFETDPDTGVAFQPFGFAGRQPAARHIGAFESTSVVPVGISEAEID